MGDDLEETGDGGRSARGGDKGGAVGWCQRRKEARVALVTNEQVCPKAIGERRTTLRRASKHRTCAGTVEAFRTAP